MNQLLKEAYERLRTAEDARSKILPAALDTLPKMLPDWVEACLDLSEARDHFHRIAYDYCREQYRNA